MRRRCGGRELDDHEEAGNLAVALEARPDDRAVEKGGPDAWATAGPRCDPLLAPRRDGVEFVGSSGKTNGWDASTSAKSERDGDGVWMTKALGLWREVGHVATSGLANVIAAAESQLVKVCASLAEAQGSIPLSLTSFYFSKLKHRY